MTRTLAYPHPKGRVRCLEAVPAAEMMSPEFGGKFGWNFPNLGA